MLDTQIPTAEASFVIPGPAGELEVLLSPPPEGVPRATAIICHPHPLYGGTMHNKVITTLSKTFIELGMQTIRFNFRGVGKSVGSFAEGIGEQEDLLAIIDWVKKGSPQIPLWLAGFSFGAYVSILTAAKMPVDGLVSIAPPINRFPFQDSPLITCPWVVVQGEQDEVVPCQDVLAWIEKLGVKPQLILFPEATHFFHGRLIELKNSLFAKLKLICGFC
jgi:uncharacterized protein